MPKSLKKLGEFNEQPVLENVEEAKILVMY
jgi:hypothetical protein